MPQPKLYLLLPHARQRAAFEHVAEVLRRDVHAGRVAITWRLPDGPDWDDDLPPDRVTVRLTPTAGPGSAFCTLPGGRVSYEAPVNVRVETRVPTLAWGESADLGNRLFSVLAPQHHGRRYTAERARRAVGISWIEFGPTPMAGADQVGIGSFRLMVYVDR